LTSAANMEDPERKGCQKVDEWEEKGGGLQEKDMTKGTQEGKGRQAESTDTNSPKKN